MQLTSGRTPGLWQILLALLLVFILSRFAVVGLAKVLFNTQSSDGDESAYLALGLDLVENGTLTDGVRPPLYPLLLSAVAARDWSYFTWAKLISLSIGALTVLVTFLIGQQLFNAPTGLLAAFLLAANREFHLRAATIYADTLLVLLFVAAWYFLITGFERRRDLIWAGLLVGLAHLTKNSATLLLAAWGLTALLTYRRQLLSQRHLLIVPVVFLLTVSPLLVYNWRTFDSPFYNFATTHVMWMDRWSESQTEDPARLPTLTTYFQTHTLDDIVARLQKGATRLNPALTTTLIPSRQFEPGWLGPALLLTAIAGAGWLFLTDRAWLKTALYRRRWLLLFSLILLGLFYFFSLWYAQVLMESRFLIPILGPVYVLLAAAVIGGLSQIWHRSAGQRQVWRWSLVGATGCAIVWGLGWLAWTAQIDSWSLSVDPFASDRAANVAPEAMQSWFERNHSVQTGPVKVVFGPSKSLPLWKFSPHFQFERIPVEVDSWPKMEAYLSQRQPNYVIIDSDTARRRRQALADYFAYREESGVTFEQIPPGWSLAHLSNAAPHTWAVFSPTAEPSQPVVANWNRQIELLGYELERPVESTSPLRVTLYWRASETMAENYTAFLHLTAPDGFVVAQHDQQPFNGLWPTTVWTPGAVQADRFEIPLPDNLTPGQYLLLTGWYNSQTGQRLPRVRGPVAPSPEAVQLTSLTLQRPLARR